MFKWVVAMRIYRMINDMEFSDDLIYEFKSETDARSWAGQLVHRINDCMGKYEVIVKREPLFQTDGG